MSRNERNRNADTTRRRLLAGLSGAGVAGLAGCSGVFGGGDGTETDDEAQDDETDSEESGDETGEESETRDDGTETPPPEPRFESVSLALPSEATVDATLSATVSVTNTGGVAGTFAGQVRVVEGASDATASFELADVGAGDAAETTVEFTFERADEYVLAVTDSEGETLAEGRVTVGPITAAVGDSLDLTENLRATLRGVEYYPMLVYDDESGFSTRTRLLAPADDRTVALLRFELENVGTESVRFTRDPLVIPDGQLYLNEVGGDLRSIRDVNGGLLGGNGTVTVGAGQRVRGFVLAQTSYEAARNGTTVGYQRDRSQTPPEYEWTVPGQSVAAFEVTDAETPDSVVQGSFDGSFTVRNVGEAAGTLRGVLERKRVDQGDNGFSTVRRVSAEVPGSGSTTVDFSDAFYYDNALEYRLRPFEQRSSVTFTPPEPTMGEAVEQAFGTISLGDVALADEIAFEDDSGTYSPDSGQFALVRVTITWAERADDDTFVGSRSFSIEAGGETYEPREVQYTNDFEVFTDPIDGAKYTYQRGPNAGQTVGGILLFEVPSSVTAENITAVWDWDPDFTPNQNRIVWSPA